MSVQGKPSAIDAAFRAGIPFLADMYENTPFDYCKATHNFDGFNFIF